ncbi:hypothetical protein [Metabacillus malikii]|uniref:Uncharacterized protein n=1 Tax=Metabacillus malikii TaxID=1504265 RepID=A0ABT9ZHQ7_9BACI|nr:hypothetical protein [Metabacillus malikii]MDQ0231794.1 hypothetical protein [Metabacillus malikii]
MLGKLLFILAILCLPVFAYLGKGATGVILTFVLMIGAILVNYRTVTKN